jgi:glycosyltransferase involved in cell wall biosynthesis
VIACTSIVGTVGVPAIYGGFETLADNLVRYHATASLKSPLMVYCSGKSYPSGAPKYLSALLQYVPLHANGPQSIVYDIWSMLSAVRCGAKVILLLGISGAIALPLIRLVSDVRVVTNIDGVEWRRAKWRAMARAFLKYSEKLAVRFSHEVIADNDVVAEYVTAQYGAKSHVIAYGGDHAVAVDAMSIAELRLPHLYATSIARIEPENNVHLILEAFSRQALYNLVFVGNWNHSDYGRSLSRTYSQCKQLILLDPIYDLGKLKTIRAEAAFYVHGHSAGGTNPSLVEAMHFGRPVIAFDCDFNRKTTEDKARYFKTAEDLRDLLSTIESPGLQEVGTDMLEIARRRYTWARVAKQYFALLGID